MFGSVVFFKVIFIFELVIIYEVVFKSEVIFIFWVILIFKVVGILKAVFKSYQKYITACLLVCPLIVLSYCNYQLSTMHHCNFAPLQIGNSATWQPGIFAPLQL